MDATFFLRDPSAIVPIRQPEHTHPSLIPRAYRRFSLQRQVE